MLSQRSNEYCFMKTANDNETNSIKMTKEKDVWSMPANSCLTMLLIPCGRFLMSKNECITLSVICLLPGMFSKATVNLFLKRKEFSVDVSETPNADPRTRKR